MFNENTSEVTDLTNQEEKIPSTYQEYLDKALKNRSIQLEDETIGKMNAPALNWKYLVDGKEVIDTFVFNMDNQKYMDFNIDRLIDTLALYGEDLVSFENPEALARKYQHLIGTKAVIKQYEYNGFKKYKVLATEKTSSI